MRNRSRRQPSFFWQSALIILPIALLAAVGLVLLRQDRARVASELHLQAQTYAERLADLMERQLFRGVGDASTRSFVVTASGELLEPKPIERVPVSRLPEIADLSESQKELWQKASTTNQSAELWRRFAELDVPRELQAHAWYQAGLGLKELGRKPEAAAAFQNVASRFGDVFTFAGLPLGPLAELQWLETAELTAPKKRDAIERCLETALAQPSPIVPLLLSRIDEMENELLRDGGGPGPSDAFRKTWQQQQALRALYDSLRRTLGSRGADAPAIPPSVWFQDSRGINWLAIPSDENTNRITVVCRPVETVASLLERREELRFPAEFGLTAEIAGQTLRAPNLPRESAAVASVTRNRDGKSLLTANVHIVDQTVFARRARSRLLWFASLIAAAALAASVGLVAAWRAFRRQQALAEMKTNFVSSVSHELRAPIASVRLLAEGLQRGVAGDGAKQQQYFGFIVQECRRLSALIENVLDFSRIERGRKLYEMELVDVSALVRQTAELMRAYAAERDVLIGAQVQDNVLAHADGRAIQQALVNLVDNAIKHSPAGAQITIGLGVNPAINGHPGAIELSVEDNGEGIPPEDHTRIFERFYRRGSELRRETHGVGIGLSIVKHIIEAHGGAIEVQSAVGKGSRFTIRLAGVKEQP